MRKRKNDSLFMKVQEEGARNKESEAQRLYFIVRSSVEASRVDSCFRRGEDEKMHEIARDEMTRDEMTRRRVEQPREPKVHQRALRVVPVRVVSGELCGTIPQTIKPITRQRPKHEMAARCLPVHASRTRGFT